VWGSPVLLKSEVFKERGEFFDSEMAMLDTLPLGDWYSSGNKSAMRWQK
jgi:hypothetical protein